MKNKPQIRYELFAKECVLDSQSVNKQLLYGLRSLATKLYEGKHLCRFREMSQCGHLRWKITEVCTNFLKPREPGRLQTSLAASTSRERYPILSHHDGREVRKVAFSGRIPLLLIADDQIAKRLAFRVGSFGRDG